VGRRTLVATARKAPKSLVCYRLALTVFSRDAYPAAWATAMVDLGTAGKNRIAGDRRANIDKAIACYQDALAVRTHDAQRYRMGDDSNEPRQCYRGSHRWRPRGEH
jgi:hypothetical protein